MRKIIFLDIDGVLNSDEYFETLQPVSAELDDIDESKVQLLKEIVDRTEAQIVLSSTWRGMQHDNIETCNKMYKYLIDTLNKYGLSIVSETPILNHRRPEEIATWVDENIGHDGMIFISLDDDFTPEQYDEYEIGDCLIKTSFYGENGGLQREHVEEAVRVLNGYKETKYEQ